jgi:hypothetical protein
VELTRCLVDEGDHHDAVRGDTLVTKKVLRGRG